MSSDDGNLVIAEEGDEEVAVKPKEPEKVSEEESKVVKATEDSQPSSVADPGPVVDGKEADAAAPMNAASLNVDLPTTSAKSPKPNGNDANSMPSEALSPDGKGAKPKNKGKPANQQNFDFDYAGPPVTVSNAMALELVNRFGLNNAWGAFLKLRGYRAPYDKSAPQPPEHIQALKRFRRKIRSIRELFNQCRDKNQDTDPVMSKEFVIQLKGTADEGAEKAESPIPTATKRKNNARQQEELEQPCASASLPENNKHVEATSFSLIPSDPTQPKKPRKGSKKESPTKKGSNSFSAINPLLQELPASATCSTAQSDALPTEGVTLTLNKRIDEIVTNVIDKVMSNSSTTGVSTPTVSTVTASTSMGIGSSEQSVVSVNPTLQAAPPLPLHPAQLAQLGVTSDQLQEMYRQNASVFPGLTHAGFPLQAMQGLLTTARPPHTQALVSPAAPFNQNAARFFFQQGPGFMEPSAGPILLPPTPQPTPAVNGVGTPFSFGGTPFGTANLIRALQVQQQQPTGLPFGGHSVGVPSSSAWAQPPITSSVPLAAVEHPAAKNALRVETSRANEKSSTKEDSPAPRASSSNSKKEIPKEKPVVPKAEEPKVSKKVIKAPQAKRSASPSPGTAKTPQKDDKKQKEFEERISELEEQISSLEEQLSAEKQKFNGQKKRMDTLRDKLKKKDDELQTAKIDYACQKTDNATLREQMRILTEENEALKGNLKLAEADAETDAPESTKDSASPTPTTTRRRGRRQTARLDPSPPQNSKTTAAVTKRPRKRKEPTPVKAEEEPEGERRQSKRISAARSKMMRSSAS